MNIISEEEIEQMALDILSYDLGYETRFGPVIVECDTPERTYAEVVLANRLQQAIDRINPSIPSEAREEALKKVLRAASVDILARMKLFMSCLPMVLM